MTCKRIIQQTPKGQYTISLPKDVVELKDWQKGTVLEFLDTRDGLLLRKVVESKE